MNCVLAELAFVQSPAWSTCVGIWAGWECCQNTHVEMPAEMSSGEFIVFNFAGDGQQVAPVLASTVQSVLSQAATHGMQSIAMPLIGHGGNGWPAKLAAISMLSKCCNSSKAAQLPGP